jgi:broad specificity phosphatase PhoE
MQRSLTVATAALVILLCGSQQALAQKLVFVVRHAERADSAATMTPQTDPSLSATGKARAARLAGLLAQAGIAAIYATEFKRTQETATPLAGRLGLTVETRAAGDTPALVADLKARHAGDIVLVVGHSNTVPAIIKAFGGPDVTIAEDEYDSLFVVVPATGVVTKIKY